LRAAREQDLMSKYVLHELLGAGGMAEVYRATYCPEGGFAKTVAVKRVLPALAADRDFVDLIRDEARLRATLAHPDLVPGLRAPKHRAGARLRPLPRHVPARDGARRWRRAVDAARPHRAAAAGDRRVRRRRAGNRARLHPPPPRLRRCAARSRPLRRQSAERA